MVESRNQTRKILTCFALAVGVVLQSVTLSYGQTDSSLPALPGSNHPSTRLNEHRVALLDSRAWSADQRSIAEDYVRSGHSGNGLAVLLRIPELAAAVHPFLAYTSHDSSLSPRHREILILRTAWLHQNAYLWSHYASSARSAGLTSRDIRRIAAGSDAGGWTAFDAMLISFADELFRNSSVSDATWAAVSAEYNVYNQIDAVMTVAEFTTLSMVFNAFGVQPDSLTTDRLPTDIPYEVVVPARERALTSPRIDPEEGTGFRVGRTIARNPQVSRLWGGNTNYVNRGNVRPSMSPLLPHDRELLILRIGWNCQAEYEWAKHVGSVGRAREHGLEPRWIAEGPTFHRWEPYEMALLTAADELYRDSTVSDDTWNELSSYYDTRKMMSIVMTVATYRFVSMTLNAFGVQLQPDDEGFPTL